MNSEEVERLFLVVNYVQVRCLFGFSATACRDGASPSLSFSFSYIPILTGRICVEMLRV
jgi:hypothetical protein